MIVRLLFMISLSVSCALAKKPNILLLYADDLGYTDLSCQGSKYYETPHIDRLAKEGTTFTNAYAGAANCAPSRACLMTGTYTPRHGIFTVGNSDRGKAIDRKLIPVKNTTILDPSFTTIAEALKPLGYRTCVAGKWHLTEDPTADGFDANFGGTTWGHPKSYFSPYKNPYLKDGPKGEHLPERLGREVANWIRANHRDPFFAYVPFYSVHTPIQATEELTQKYSKKEPDGKHNNPKYAAMIQSMDNAVGHLLETLDDLELTQETLVIFTSDNGPHGSISAADPLRGSKGMFYEGGIREPFLVRFPGRTPAGQKNESVISQIDLFPTFVELAGGKIPPDLDGVSLLPAFHGEKLRERPLFWHFPAYLQGYNKGSGSASKYFRTTPCGVIREGNWKLIQYFEDHSLELYHLESDLAETTNLATKHPKKTEELLEKLQDWQARTQAPIPTKKNPQYQPR